MDGGAEERELWKEGYEERLISELKGRDYEVAKRRIGGGYAFMRYVWVVSKGGRELLEIGPFETTTLGGIRGFSIGIWIVFPWRTYEIKLLERSDEALRALNDYFTTSIVTKLYLGSLTSRPIEYKILGETKRVDFPSLKEEEAGKILDKLIEA
jgi:hypothetical protein